MNKIKYILNIFLIIFAFYITLLITLPLKDIFLYINNKLYENCGVILTEKNIKQNYNKLLIDNLNIYYKNKIILGKIEKIIFSTLLFDNIIKIKQLNIDFNNIKINDLKIKYNVLHPFIVKLYSSKSNIADSIKGDIDIHKKKIKIYLYNPDFNKLFFLKIKKLNNGVYYYEHRY